jgi:hypothetical protein
MQTAAFSPARPPTSPALQAPDADTLEKFLGRLPLMFKARCCGIVLRAVCTCVPGSQRCCGAALFLPVCQQQRIIPFPSPFADAAPSLCCRLLSSPPTATLGRPMCWACQTQAARWDTDVALRCGTAPRGLSSPCLA